MRRRGYLWLLTTIAVIPSQLWAGWEPYNENHGPFEPNSWPRRFSLHRCDSMQPGGLPMTELVVKSCHGIRDRPGAAMVYAGSRPNQRGTWLLVKNRNGLTVAGPQQVGELCASGRSEKSFNF
jgi:hypothetical protein